MQKWHGQKIYLAISSWDAEWNINACLIIMDYSKEQPVKSDYKQNQLFKSKSDLRRTQKNEGECS